MQKAILITGATDGIGLAAARALAAHGHMLLLHGRNPAKLERVQMELSALPGAGKIETCLADLSRMTDVEAMAAAVCKRHERLDVLINNAGVFKSADPVTADGLDVRFAVNTLAPYLLTQCLLQLLGAKGRVVNVASAAQAPVDLQALAGRRRLADDFEAYAQSKLALIMWSRSMGLARKDAGPVVVAINPGSMLGTKMVQEAFGVPGGDVRIGADVLIRAALSEEFAAAGGAYYDNDCGRFASPHPDALDAGKCKEVVGTIEAVLAEQRR